MLRKILLCVAIAVPLGALAGDRGGAIGAIVARLEGGNARFVADLPSPADVTSLQRTLTSTHQRPWATVLGCADSRVPAEHIFSGGLGDIFDVRVAGNVSDGVTLASLEYAVSVLETPVLVVLGHSDCGAAKAFLDGKVPFPSMEFIFAAMGPPRNKDRQATPDGVARANVTFQVGKLARSEIISKALTDKTLLLRAAFYDVATGEVTWLDEQHPTP